MKKYVMISLFCSFFLSLGIRAESIHFKTGGFYYDLETSPDLITLKGYMIDLSFRKRECNEFLVESLYDKIKDVFRHRILVEKNYYLVTWKKKEYKISQNSELGRFLYSFPNIAKENKRKEAFLCRREKK